MNLKEIRWKQRFHNFERSFELLKRTSEIKELSEAEKGGLIQFFEVSFELAWKTLKDYLESEGFIVNSPRETIKTAFENGIIENGELWIEALTDRNRTVHLYDEELVAEITDKIINNYLDILSLFHDKFKNI